MYKINTAWTSSHGQPTRPTHARAILTSSNTA
ncbi:hypothetical protein F383_34257 [Gossypium arboreum]|uniref:Uncharacterized protein n=1 Tax=Gossypium arboreum TaxID=29729 RepID=A0A0B0N432_GOSAR|nr:hypothetical protein F383_34257 [Gossypium arboreum]